MKERKKIPGGYKDYKIAPKRNKKGFTLVELQRF